MFARVFAVLPLALLAVATSTNNVCSARNSKCCKQVSTVGQAAQSGGSFLSILTLLEGLAADVVVAADCTNVLGSSCAAASTCCTGDNFNSGFALINANCDTIQL